ncbi:MAG TPA: exosortase-associated EpsI family protein [Gemmataceae bacterium]|nr:exosortase-associated EpsI family protein [Gemmataceae bacterium]
MRRLLPILTGLALVVGVGFVHGTWTGRWSQGAAVEAAVARLPQGPCDLGDWHGEPSAFDPAELAKAGVAGSWVEQFRRRGDGSVVLVMLLCGRPGEIAVHRPEHCYSGAGYEMLGAPAPCTLDLAGDAAPAQLWTARFRKPEAAEARELRIFWTWYGGGSWQAPAYPRFAFARYPALYKLYAVREVRGGLGRAEDDPCTDLLDRLLPWLGERLGSR